ncbi:MAG: hypothetical protein M3401_06715 [Actinomycetota bacterium]|nr:hypothetical protein [Actinomycetota bacterium]
MPRRTADAGPERVPDWMLGGVARRRVLERLAEPGPGWSGKDLAEDLGLGRAWTFEIMRILRAVNALEQPTAGRYRLASHEPLARSLRDLLAALEPFNDTPVDRPPSRQR